MLYYKTKNPRPRPTATTLRSKIPNWWFGFKELALLLEEVAVEAVEVAVPELLAVVVAEDLTVDKVEVVVELLKPVAVAEVEVVEAEPELELDLVAEAEEEDEDDEEESLDPLDPQVPLDLMLW